MITKCENNMHSPTACYWLHKQNNWSISIYFILCPASRSNWIPKIHSGCGTASIMLVQKLIHFSLNAIPILHTCSASTSKQIKKEIVCCAYVRTKCIVVSCSNLKIGPKLQTTIVCCPEGYTVARCWNNSSVGIVTVIIKH